MVASSSRAAAFISNLYVSLANNVLCVPPLVARPLLGHAQQELAQVPHFLRHDIGAHSSLRLVEEIQVHHVQEYQLITSLPGHGDSCILRAIAAFSTPGGAQDLAPVAPRHLEPDQ